MYSVIIGQNGVIIGQNDVRTIVLIGHQNGVSG